MTGATRRLLKVFGEVIHVNEFIHGGEARAGNYVFQLADIAGPSMLEQDGLRAARKPLNLLAVRLVVLLQKILDDQGNIIQPLAQAGNSNLNRAETVEEILTKAASKNLRAQIAVRSCDQAHVHAADFGCANALNFPVLNHTEQFGLHRQRCLSDFVEKDGSAVGVFEQPRARIGRAREGPAHVSEELALK